MKWFGQYFKRKVTATSSYAQGSKDRDKEPSMHMLALDPLTKELFGFIPEGEDPVSVPAITTDGRISFLPAGNIEDFYKLRQAVADRMTKQHPDAPSAAHVAVVAVNIGTDIDQPITHSFFIFEVLSSSEPMPELEQIYYLLTGLRQVGDKHWAEVEKFFSSEPRKSWINSAIEIWKKKLNWAEYVDRALEYHRQSSRKEEQE